MNFSELNESRKEDIDKLIIDKGKKLDKLRVALFAITSLFIETKRQSYNVITAYSFIPLKTL